MGEDVGDCPGSAPLLKFGTFGPRLIYRTMEKPVFTKTRNFAEFCNENGLPGLRFKPYTRKSGPNAGTKGLWATFTVGDTEVKLAVANALVPLKDQLTASMLEVSNVTWPDGTKSVLVHGVGEESKYVGASS